MGRYTPGSCLRQGLHLARIWHINEWLEVLVNAVTRKVGAGSNLSDRVRRLGLGTFDLGRRLSS